MALTGRQKFDMVKSLLLILSKVCKIFPMSLRKKLLQHYRKTKGMKGIAIRYILLKSIAKQCGNNVSIHEDVYILSPEKLVIGDNVSIQPMCYIDATGEMEIGNNVSIAHLATVLSTTHTFDLIDIPIKYQPVLYKKTVIKDDVLICSKATIVYGITINSHSVVGANSVVTKDVPENKVVAGAPAKVIKDCCLK